MNGTSTVSISLIIWMVFLIGSQILGTSLLPRTAGFTAPYWTAACLGAYGLSMWGAAYVINRGMPLSQMTPILASTVPLASIAVGMIVYGEPASILKVVLLSGACGLVGIASAL